MSRVGRRPITLTGQVKVTVDGRHLKVVGPLGELSALLPVGIEIHIEGNELNVVAPEANRVNRGFQGLVRALVANMVFGVVHGYEIKLEINGVGYKVEMRGTSLIFSLGYTHTITVHLPKLVSAQVDKSQTKLSLKSIDKQLVGQLSAQIYSFKKPEPYKGKGVNYVGRPIRRKAGKAGAK